MPATAAVPGSPACTRCPVFALSRDYLVAALLLVIGGIADLAAVSITQTMVQLRAPREKKGQVISVYGTSASGMRIGSGFTVGAPGIPATGPYPTGYPGPGGASAYGVDAATTHT